MNKHHNQWTSSLGFILATAGAAIGLGNLWKFPYLMGSNGGFTFLIAYLIFVVILGIPVMMMEMSFGRYMGKDPVASYKEVNPKAGIIGFFGVAAAFIILSYYSIIGGWLFKYFFSYMFTFEAPTDFAGFIGGGEAVFWLFVFLAVSAFICIKGVSGIEKTSKVMMPLLFILLIIVIIRSVTLPNSMEGLKFIFVPGYGGKFNFASISAALGQVFYSLSLCMGITITYGSYLSKKEDIKKSCTNVAVMDTIAAVMAGVAIFPAVFSFGLKPTQGPSLIFETLPKVFAEIPAGAFFAMAFFALILFAAVTSSVALVEVVTAYTVGQFKMERKKAIIFSSVLMFLLGIPSSLSSGTGPLSTYKFLNYNFFDFVCMLTDNILLPLSGLLMCWFFGWRWNINHLADEIEEGSKGFKLRKVWIFLIKYIMPILILVITISGFVSIYHTITAV